MRIYKNFVATGLLLALIVPISSFAADTNPNAGLTPRSPFYFLDIFFEKIDLFFTPNPAGKARKNIAYAAERLAEVEESALDKDSRAAERATELYEKNVADAAQETKNIEDKKESEELLDTLNESVSRQKEALKEVFEKVPEEAKPVIQKAMEANLRQHAQILQELAELKEAVGELQEETAEIKEEAKQLQTELEKTKACNEYNRLRAEIKDFCGSQGDIGINGCIYDANRQYLDYKNDIRGVPVQAIVDRELAKVNKLKELKVLYVAVARKCGISLDSENKRSQEYIQDIEQWIASQPKPVPLAPVIGGIKLEDIPQDLRDQLWDVPPEIRDEFLINRMRLLEQLKPLEKRIP